MKTQFINYGIYFLLAAILSCSNNTKQKEINLDKKYTEIQAIYSIANCDSPFGKYTTEVHSFIDGSCYFKQEFLDNNSPFIVKIDSNNKGYIIDENEIVMDTLGKLDVEMIRGHEIHKMTINPEFYFKNLVYQKQNKHLGIDHELYNGNDVLNNPVEIIYNRNKKLISKIELINPKDSTQLIEILYDKWIQSNFGNMAKEIRIVQAKKDTFHFNYSSLKIRDKNGYTNIFNP